MAHERSFLPVMFSQQPLEPLDLDIVSKKVKEIHERMDAANPPKPEPIGDEYSRLNMWHKSLSERLQHSETRLGRANDRAKSHAGKLKSLQDFEKSCTNRFELKKITERIADVEGDLREALRWQEACQRMHATLVQEQESFPSARLNEVKRLVNEEENRERRMKEIIRG